MTDIDSCVTLVHVFYMQVTCQ